ncbi:MAG: thioesterase [bacterium]|nr:thioesterase [bacterium]
MIIYCLRVIIGLIEVLIKPGRLEPLETSIIKRWVLLSDCDFNLHLNNGKVQTSMDYGRNDLLIRAGLVKHVIKEKWRPMVGSSIITYKKSLALYSLYELHTKIKCWDEKWVYLEQSIYHKGALAAQAYIKALLRGPNGNVPPAELIKKLGIEIDSPPIPEAIIQWNKVVQ